MFGCVCAHIDRHTDTSPVAQGYNTTGLSFCVALGIQIVTAQTQTENEEIQFVYKKKYIFLQERTNKRIPKVGNHGCHSFLSSITTSNFELNPFL